MLFHFLFRFPLLFRLIFLFLSIPLQVLIIIFCSVYFLIADAITNREIPGVNSILLFFCFFPLSCLFLFYHIIIESIHLLLMFHNFCLSLLNLPKLCFWFLDESRNHVHHVFQYKLHININILRLTHRTCHNTTRPTTSWYSRYFS